MDINVYNKQLREQYERVKSMELLGKYVVSETISPIADYPNAIRIIRSNYCCQVNSTLLFIGSYLVSQWDRCDNEFLGILNQMYAYLPQKERSIVSFLNAQHLRFRQEDYEDNPVYEEYLLKSLNNREPFVENRRFLVELYIKQKKKDKAKAMHKEALSNVVEVHYKKEIMKISIEQLVEPEQFVNEHILGTHISYVNYESLTDMLKMP